MSLHLRIFTLAALAVTTAHPAAAQNTSGMLNVFEVQRLVAAFGREHLGQYEFP